MSRFSRPESGKPPAYQYHISGQARVKINYPDYFLGEFGTRDSRKLYALVIAEYEKFGQTPDKDWFKRKKEKQERSFLANAFRTGGIVCNNEIPAATNLL